MSEEQEAPVAAEEEGKKSSSMVRTLGLAIGALMVVAIAALVVFKVVLAPRLAGEDETKKVEDVPDIGDKIPLNAVTVAFDESIAAVKLPLDSELSSSILSHQVALECYDAATAALVEKYKDRFTDLINEKHEFRTRAELDDPRIKESIEKEILLEANTLLKRLQPGEIDPNIRITAVLHLRFFPHDQI